MRGCLLVWDCGRRLWTGGVCHFGNGKVKWGKNMRATVTIPPSLGERPRLERGAGVLRLYEGFSCVDQDLVLVLVAAEVVQRVVSTLLHDTVELLLIDDTIAITICLINHFLELLVSQVFAQFPSHALQVLE